MFQKRERATYLYVAVIALIILVLSITFAVSSSSTNLFSVSGSQSANADSVNTVSSVSDLPNEYTQITNGAELSAWIRKSDDGTELYKNGVIMNNITDYSRNLTAEHNTSNKDVSSEINLATGRTLNGNNHEVLATVSVKDGIWSNTTGPTNQSRGYIIDNNFGTIKNLTVTTANDLGVDDNNDNGFLVERTGRFALGVVVGGNQGIIDNVTANINHVVKLRAQYSGSQVTWSFLYLGGLVGGNYTLSATQGIISNSTVNIGAGASLIIIPWASNKHTAYSAVAPLVGVQGSDAYDVVSIKNATVNWNGGKISVASNNQGNRNMSFSTLIGDNRNYTRTDAWVTDRSARVDGVIINGKPNYTKMNNDGGRFYTLFYLHQQDGLNRFANAFVAEEYFQGDYSGVGDDQTNKHGQKYTRFSGMSLAFKDGKLAVTKDGFNADEIIYDINGTDTFSQNQGDIATSGTRTVLIDLFTAVGQGTAFAWSDESKGTMKYFNPGNNVYEENVVYGDGYTYPTAYIAAKFGLTADTFSMEALTGNINSISFDKSCEERIPVRYNITDTSVLYNDSVRKIVAMNTTGSTSVVDLAFVTIAQKDLSVTYDNIGNVYDSYVTVSGLIAGQTLEVSGAVVANIGNGRYDLTVVGEYAFATNNKNYNITSEMISGNVVSKTISVSGLKYGSLVLADNTDGVTFENNTIIIAKRNDNIIVNVTSAIIGYNVNSANVVGGTVNGILDGGIYVAIITDVNNMTSIEFVSNAKTLNVGANSNGNGTVTVDKSTLAYGEVLTFVATPDTGANWVFDCWKNGDSVVSYAENFTTSIFKDTMLTAYFKSVESINAINVSYFMLDGSLMANSILSNIEEIDSVIYTNSELFKTFAGWNSLKMNDNTYHCYPTFTTSEAADVYTIVVKGGVDIEKTITNISFNTSVTLQSTSENFVGWAVNGEIVSTDSSYTFSVLGNITVEELTGESTSTDATDNKLEHKIADGQSFFYGTVALPSDAVITNARLFVLDFDSIVSKYEVISAYDVVGKAYDGLFTFIGRNQSVVTVGTHFALEVTYTVNGTQTIYKTDVFGK